ncbi:MAG: type II toxin-antitoxin system Phd/YefM family antitoxin [Kiloniellales bacterium]
MTKQYSIAQARDQLPRIVHAVERDGAVEITRRGRPVAMLVSVQEYARLSDRRVGFWQALEAFRRDAGRDLALCEDVFVNLRDPTPGRRVNL